MHMPEVAKIFATEFLEECHDPKKTCHVHLSSQNGALSWLNSCEEENTNALVVHVVNDPCESTFGVLTDELKTHENVGLTHAGGMAMCRKNGDFATGHRKVNKNGECVLCTFNITNVLNVNLLKNIKGKV